MASHEVSTAGLRIAPGKAPNLSKRSSEPDPKVDKAAAKPLLAAQTDELANLQDTLYARSTHAVLAVFQARDAAGKDSTIKHVFAGVNPQGVQVAAFKAPTAEEVAHDFLWRVNAKLPARGHIGVFNRSHYEETLVVRVHPEFLAAQNLPEGETGDKLWKHRYASINEWEQRLDRSGTKIVKFFLNVSRDEQRKRFLARIDEPDKNWKFSEGDLSERARWDDYTAAYEDTIRETSTEWAPWYVIPADHKPTMRVLVSRILLDTLRGLDLTLPEIPDEERAALAAAREKLAND